MQPLELELSHCNIQQEEHKCNDHEGYARIVSTMQCLGDILEKGVKIDAVVSQDLITTIFFPNTALHDGAVIVNNERIVAAAAILPVSNRELKDRSMGLRHRAGIGLAEASDAVVIIVSEETGTISLSVEGNLTRNYNYNSLKKELNSLLMSQTLGEHTKRHAKRNRKGKYCGNNSTAKPELNCRICRLGS